MNKSGFVNSIKSSLAQLENLNAKSFFKAWIVDQSFELYKPDYENFIERFLTILENSNSIGNKTLKRALKILENYIFFVSNVIEIDDVNFIINRQLYIKSFEKHVADLEEVWLNIKTTLKDKFLDVLDEKKDLEKELEQLLKQIKDEQKEVRDELENTKNIKNSLEQELINYKDRYNNINTNVELETQVNVFETQSNKNLANSNWWLGGIIASSVLLIIILVVIYCNFGLPAQGAKDYVSYKSVCESCAENVLWVDMIRYIFFKLLIISTNIYVLSFCVKNYNACMHNKTNNEHRHNSFRAALHFYNTTTSEKKEEILIKVADAIFTYQKSGYYGKDSEPSNPSIIQSVAEKLTGK